MSMASRHKENVISGISWSMGSQLFSQASQFISFFILARILLPEDFGLIAMITVITHYAKLLVDIGLGNAVVQSGSINQNQISTVFWLSVALSLCLCLIFLAASPFIAHFYGEPELEAVVDMLALNFILIGLYSIQQNLFHKKLQFKKLFIINAIAYPLSITTAIVMAVKGFSYWSLVGQHLSLSFVILILSWAPAFQRGGAAGWKPSFIFRFRAIKPLFVYSKNLFLSQTMNYWMRNFDNFLIGKFLGATPLGFYSRAYSLMLFPIQNFARVISNVLFPSFSIIQNNSTKIRNTYLKVVIVISYICFPVYISVIVFAEELILVFLGENWLEMTQILQILCVAGFPTAVLSLNGSIYMSKGRTDLQFRVALFLQSITIISFLIGINFGVLGMALAFAISEMIKVIPGMYYPFSLIDLRLSQFFKTLAPVLLINALLLVAAVLLKDNVMDISNLPLIVKLPVCFLAMGLVYFLLSAVSGNPIILEFYNLFREKLLSGYQNDKNS